MSKKLRANLLLILAAAIWGGAFVAQSVGNDIGSFTFNGARSLVGVAALLPVIFIADKTKKPEARKPWPLAAGLLCGLFVTVATTLQQFGLAYTSAGKAGFITALYIVLVPVASLLLARFGKNAAVAKAAAPATLARLVISLAVAVAGMYLLCIGGAESGIGVGDLLVFGCAIVFTFQILTVDRVAATVDCLKLSCIQFAVCGAANMLCAFIFEQPSLPELADAWVPLAYAGVLSCGVAYTLQMVGQKDSDPTVASLLMSLESVFAVLAGWLVLGERLTAREFVGCALMLCAIVLVQLPSRKRRPADKIAG